MADARLNSNHLESDRREEFRQARSKLMKACGAKTKLAVGQQEPTESPSGSRTAIQKLESRLPAGLDCMLVDDDTVYPLKTGVNTIGRAADNDVVVNDPFVSRRHCAILIHTDAGTEIHDVASKNGTFLNCRRLAGPTVLVTGDEIRMCDRRLVFVMKALPRPRTDEGETEPE